MSAPLLTEIAVVSCLRRGTMQYGVWEELETKSPDSLIA